MIQLTDTHSHVYADRFSADTPAMLAAAKAAGVRKILMPAIDSETHTGMLALEEAHPDYCLSMMGLHPCSVTADYQQELTIVEEWFVRRRFIAVGETGLDFYWDLTYSEQQYIAFRRQIELALEHDIPVVIHSRNSTDECIAVIKEYQKGELKGVFHCFSGNAAQAQQIVDLGFYLGIGGVATFKNGGLDQALARISLDHMVLETDAPYLAPVPYRGKRNEPAYIRYVADKLAEWKEIATEEVARITTKNAEKLFGL